jgi:hypothetical protein
MGEASDAGEVFVERENGSAVIDGNGGNQGIDGGQANTPGTGETKDDSGVAIRGKTHRIENVPHGKIAFDFGDATGQALQDLGYDHSGNRERLGIGYHAAKFFAGASGDWAEKIDPDGAIDQNQSRFLRAAFKFPFQIPLP